MRSKSFLKRSALFTLSLSMAWTSLLSTASSQERIASTAVTFGPYEYEAKPADPAFDKFNPRKAPQHDGTLYLKVGDRLAICGDSITEQKKYSRLIETYLAACAPQLEISVRQYGWSGEKTDGFLRRMDRDCLTFDPTIATLCYGMNDARYRPYDATNGQWFEDHLTAIVQKFQQAGTRVILGSPGPAGKLATWVKSRAGTLDEHNIHLCALRDIGIQVSKQHNVRFADLFWPMYQASVLADRKYSTADDKYDVAGEDGIHPGWAGQVMMAYGFLHAMGLDGQIGNFHIDLTNNQATASEGHAVDEFSGNALTITSSRYPFCGEGPVDRDDSIRSGLTLVPFDAELNRFTLQVDGLEAAKARITWGENSRVYGQAELAAGVNLAADFEQNPFCQAFRQVDEAVAAKQAYETTQVKKIFHGKQGKENFPHAVQETEAARLPLVEAVQQAMQPVTHRIVIEAIES
ncbi:SGNH/GDSL hydrolase family protein [Aureliella helgolandensis]|uniref:SGNH hydrolase-type esterase domain-containing protein n=1 Tax=Aureliella helgolandensis TaxID=2527968 RepID=A0A518G7M4_9BACT|nr:SGNH/GDSL hydrolase family protein [Aureliella helgolandensis]QDV24591.1 hypothetical protein Q31a_29110 [Aureliella helgolandensis]